MRGGEGECRGERRYVSEVTLNVYFIMKQATPLLNYPLSQLKWPHVSHYNEPTPVVFLVFLLNITTPDYNIDDIEWLYMGNILILIHV